MCIQYSVCVGGVLGLRPINTCPKVPLQVNFVLFLWVLSMSQRAYYPVIAGGGGGEGIRRQQNTVYLPSLLRLRSDLKFSQCFEFSQNGRHEDSLGSRLEVPNDKKSKHRNFEDKIVFVGSFEQNRASSVYCTYSYEVTNGIWKQ